MSIPSIALVGCGKMGSALLRGWLAADMDGTITVLEPGGLPGEFSSAPQVKAVTEAADLTTPDILVLAVKPQIMSAVCASLKGTIGPNTLVLSIAAGQTIARFEAYFSDTQPIIRVMPNTPAAIAQGISTAVANDHATDKQKETASQLLEAVGKVVWLADENLMDAVTALSGSGPAYVFLLMEILAEAGEKAGLPPEIATPLARQTVIGSAALAASEETTAPETLRRNVTSPGGTTEAALKILMNGELQALFDEALSAATKRSRELAK
ncbi:MAG: pyrroline-5-carboxylate reductase [Rhodospirillales bacterium]|nr:pyrroline-5-carboxylate reductase [Rhodospirillales bacterium]